MAVIDLAKYEKEGLVRDSFRYFNRENISRHINAVGSLCSIRALCTTRTSSCMLQRVLPLTQANALWLAMSEAVCFHSYSVLLGCEGFGDWHSARPSACQ